MKDEDDVRDHDSDHDHDQDHEHGTSHDDRQDDSTDRRSYDRPPLHVEELIQAVPIRPPLTRFDPDDFVNEIELLINADDEPEIEVITERTKHQLIGVDEDRQAACYRVRLKIPNRILGAIAEPPPVSVEQVETDHSVTARRPEFDALVPDHLAIRALPRRIRGISEEARLLYADPEIRNEDRIYQATTIFGPDDRYTFRDTSYPWSTIGRVTSPLGSASGVMVGPRHFLTCSHAVQWLPNNSAGWIRFAPASYDGNEPFGAAWGTRIYWEGVKVFGPTISRNEAQHDYVCVVLDRNLGNVTGWMGSRSWSDSWDGGNYWSHVGYPGDLGGQRPSYQGSIALDGSFWDREVHTRIFHQGDVWPGQSGGPFFGWWAGESFPRVVADQSAQNSDENIASGGAHMVNCIIRARNAFP